MWQQTTFTNGGVDVICVDQTPWLSFGFNILPYFAPGSEVRKAYQQGVKKNT